MTVACDDPVVTQLLDAARAIPGVIVDEYPQRSWLHEGDPFGWSISWETWSMTIAPTPPEYDGAAWMIAYADDDGTQHVFTPGYALGLIVGLTDPDTVKDIANDPQPVHNPVHAHEGDTTP